MNNSDRLKAKKNMMIESKIVSEVWKRQRNCVNVYVCVYIGLCVCLCVEVRLNGMQQTEELQRH